MRIFIEFNDVFDRPEWNTGVQRAMRNLAINTRSVKGIKIIPVLLKNGNVFDAEKYFADHNGWWKQSTYLIKLDRSAQKLWALYGRWLALATINKSGSLKKILWLIFKVVCQPIALLMKLCRFWRWRKALGDLKSAEISRGDVFVWMGSPLKESDTALIQKLQADGLQIVTVIYDLFCLLPDDEEDDIKLSLPPLMQMAQGHLTISQTVQKSTIRFFKKYQSSLKNPNPWVDFFYLGSNLDLVTKEDSAVRQKVKDIFCNNKSVYLMVGMSCEHKNHEFALEAFEGLWQQDIDVVLLIVGRAGLESSQAVKRFKNHVQWNKRLFLLDDAGDDELKFCYENARALILPSKKEGFGLPLIEGLQYGLPVIVSDIPIFREVGGDFVSYFDLSEPGNLSRIVAGHEGIIVDNSSDVKSIQNWKWNTPEESLQQLVNRIHSNISSL